MKPGRRQPPGHIGTGVDAHADNTTHRHVSPPNTDRKSLSVAMHLTAAAGALGRIGGGLCATASDDGALIHHPATRNAPIANAHFMISTVSEREGRRLFIARVNLIDIA